MKTLPAFLGPVILSLCLAPRLPAAEVSGPATTPPADLRTTINLMRADVEAEKAELIAKNIPFTVDEAAAFWPVYQAYTAELNKLKDDRLALIKEYLDKHNGLSDADAARLTPRVFDLAERRIQLRRSYFGKLAQIIPPAKAAQFSQIDEYLESLIDLRIVSSLPLIK